MIKVTDLMIGDWIRISSDDSINNDIRGKAVQVLGLCDEDAEIRVDLGNDTVYGYFWSESEDDFAPIPLTAEILEKNGFEHLSRTSYYDYESLDGYVVRYDAWDKRLKVLKDLDVAYNSGDYADIYVHTLQHVLKLLGINKEITL